MDGDTGEVHYPCMVGQVLDVRWPVSTHRLPNKHEWECHWIRQSNSTSLL